MAKTLYDTLEVIPTASPETIHAAYRSLISRYHPDKVAGLGPELQAVAVARTKEINHAFDILHNAVRRASYDRELCEAEGPLLLPQDTVLAPPVSHMQRASAAPIVRAPAVHERVVHEPVVHEPQGRRLSAAFYAALTGIAALLALPHAADITFDVANFLTIGHTQDFQEFVNSIDGDTRYSGLVFLLILWGWLFVNYLFGLICYRLAVHVGERITSDFGEPVAGTNGRLFLFLTFVCVVAADEFFFFAHTMTNILADMFVLAGAYRAERGIA
jgi:DnaJ domain